MGCRCLLACIDDCSEYTRRLMVVVTGVQTQMMLCVADSSPAMFKSFAACKLDVDTSSEHGEDSVQLWGAVTVRAISLHYPLFLGMCVLC